MSTKALYFFACFLILFHNSNNMAFPAKRSGSNWADYGILKLQDVADRSSGSMRMVWLVQDILWVNSAYIRWQELLRYDCVQEKASEAAIRRP